MKYYPSIFLNEALFPTEIWKDNASCIMMSENDKSLLLGIQMLYEAHEDTQLPAHFYLQPQTLIPL
jgi:hypothetical protein